LNRLLNVTPGDFAAVVRQGRFRPVVSAAEFVTALEGECGVKEGVKVGIGFMH
jgi:transitional endoplasmic reticulum ATPase